MLVRAAVSDDHVPASELSRGTGTGTGVACCSASGHIEPCKLVHVVARDLARSLALPIIAREASGHTRLHCVNLKPPYPESTAAVIAETIAEIIRIRTVLQRVLR